MHIVWLGFCGKIKMGKRESYRWIQVPYFAIMQGIKKNITVASYFVTNLGKAEKNIKWMMRKTKTNF